MAINSRFVFIGIDMKPQFANQYAPPTPGSQDRELWARVNYLLGEFEQLKGQLVAAQGQFASVPKLQTQVVAVSDALTQLSTFVGKGNTQFNSSSVTIAGGGVGLSLAGASDTVVITVTSAPTFRSAIGLGVLATKNQATAVGAVSGSAAVVYDAATQTLINDTKTALNSLLANLLAAGVTV